MVCTFCSSYEEEEFLDIDSDDARGCEEVAPENCDKSSVSQHDDQQAGPSKRPKFVVIESADNEATNYGDQSFSSGALDDSNLNRKETFRLRDDFAANQSNNTLSDDAEFSPEETLFTMNPSL